MPFFNGPLSIEDFLDWLYAMDRFFKFYDLSIPDEKKAKCVAFKLKDGGNKCNLTEFDNNFLLRARFLAADYDQILFNQLQNCRQGN